MQDALDHKTTLADLRAEVAQFVAERNWERYHNPKAVAMSIAIEAAELLEHFQWLEPDDSWKAAKDDSTGRQVADELADVLIYCLGFANLADIDISTAVQSKLAENRIRFPIQPGGNPPG